MATFRDAFPILMVADLRRSLEFHGDRLGFNGAVQIGGSVVG